MKIAFTRAFEVWETDFREHPEQYMTNEEVAAMEILPLSEQRMVCFVAILDKLAAGRPWDQIEAAS